MLWGVLAAPHWPAMQKLWGPEATAAGSYETDLKRRSAKKKGDINRSHSFCCTGTSSMTTIKAAKAAGLLDATSNVCGFCGQAAATARCVRCKAVFYCDRECQRQVSGLLRTAPTDPIAHTF